MKRDLIGKRVGYSRKGTPHARNGWQGTIISVQEENPSFQRQDAVVRFTVLWDNNIEQSYHIDALEGGESYNGYIHFIKEERMANPCLVCGINGGQIHRVDGVKEAEKMAEKLARESKSGQAYGVFILHISLQKEEPPVRKFYHNDVSSVLVG